MLGGDSACKGLSDDLTSVPARHSACKGLSDDPARVLSVNTGRMIIT